MTELEIRTLVELLSKCEAGNLPPEVFEAVARVAVYSAIEFIPLRLKNGNIEVLLLERDNDDIMWPQMLHTPGTVLRPTDVSIENAFDRLFSDELIGLSTKHPEFIGLHMGRNRRGTCLLLEHIVEVTSEPKVGSFYDVNNLPDKFIAEQLDSLRRAVAIYGERLTL